MSIMHYQWNPVEFFDGDTTPLFHLNCPASSEQHLREQCQNLTQLPLEQALKIIVDSAPVLTDAAWQTVEAHLSAYDNSNPMIYYLLEIGSRLRQMLPDTERLVRHNSLQDAAVAAACHLQAMPDALERFAFVACLHHLAKEHTRAQVIFFYVLRLERDRMEPVRVIRQFFQQLTCRQQEVAALASRGYTNAEIAPLLHIEPCVVAEHLTSIYRKLQDCIGEVPDASGTRYRLIHLLTRLFEHHPDMRPDSGM
jgi:hypothetical protein